MSATLADLAAGIVCKHCGVTTKRTEQQARAVGWRMFDGVSQTGKPLSDVVCPTCSGAERPPVEGSWNVQCTSCGWEYLEGLDDDTEADELLHTEQEAKDVAKDHDCEPEFRLMPPGPDAKWSEPKEAWRL